MLYYISFHSWCISVFIMHKRAYGWRTCAHTRTRTHKKYQSSFTDKTWLRALLQTRPDPWPVTFVKALYNRGALLHIQICHTGFWNCGTPRMHTQPQTAPKFAALRHSCRGYIYTHTHTHAHAHTHGHIQHAQCTFRTTTIDTHIHTQHTHKHTHTYTRTGQYSALEVGLPNHLDWWCSWCVGWALWYARGGRLRFF